VKNTNCEAPRYLIFTTIFSVTMYSGRYNLLEVGRIWVRKFALFLIIGIT